MSLTDSNSHHGRAGHSHGTRDHQNWRQKLKSMGYVIRNILYFENLSKLFYRVLKKIMKSCSH